MENEGNVWKGKQLHVVHYKNGLTIYTHLLDIEESKKGNSSHKAG